MPVAFFWKDRLFEKDSLCLSPPFVFKSRLKDLHWFLTAAGTLGREGQKWRTYLNFPSQVRLYSWYLPYRYTVICVSHVHMPHALLNTPGSGKVCGQLTGSYIQNSKQGHLWWIMALHALLASRCIRGLHFHLKPAGTMWEGQPWADRANNVISLIT